MNLFLDARTVLLERLIDYTALFAPESCDMHGAVAGYRRAIASQHGWMVARFVCPATRLGELADVLSIATDDEEVPWPISVILDADHDAAADSIRSFAARMEPLATIEAVESRVDPGVPRDAVALEAAADALVAVAAEVGPVVSAVVEVPVAGLAGEDVDGAMAVIGRARVASGGDVLAKIRCGGPDAEAFPSADLVTSFLLSAVRAQVSFKATSGLHHPFRDRDFDICVTRNGFLNIAVASALAAAGVTDQDVLLEVMSDGDPDSFAFSSAGVSWAGRAANIDAIRRSRASVFRTYGSSRLDVPLRDLHTLGVLPGDA